MRTVFKIALLLCVITLCVVHLQQKIANYHHVQLKTVADQFETAAPPLRLNMTTMDSINVDSITHFSQKLDSILCIFKENYQVEKTEQITNTDVTKVHHDSKQKRILLTGDSMGDLLFFPLRTLRKKNGFQITYKPDYGSKISKWAKTKRLVTYIKKYRPDLVIFTMGSNEILWLVKQQKIKNIHKIKKHLKGTEFVWVGPPNWQKDWGLDSAIHTNIGKSNYFVSKCFNFKRNPDGAHPTAHEGKIWTDTLMRWINQNPIYTFKFKHLPPRPALEFQRICNTRHLK